ncbi:hypothetical protein K8R03_02780 [Candidatus Kaiserbacteria bacterium]|nr:hypothetical protein [Candidatus Kaiserbacteria bacterium]
MIDRDGFAALAEQTLEHFFLTPPADTEQYGIGVTSGTSRSKVLVAMREYPVAQGIFSSGPGRMLSTRGSLSTALNNAVFTKFRSRHFNARILTLDRADYAADIMPLLSDFAPDGITGYPHIMSQLADYMDAGTRDGVRSAEYVGEGLTASLNENLRRSFPRAKVSMAYMASEIGGIGRSCEFLPENQYHPLSGVTVEVLEPDDTGEGEVLVSKTIAFGIMVRQYRLADIGRIKPGTCRCGKPVTFEIVGRLGRDYVRLAGATFRRDLFDRIATANAELFEDYRIEAFLENDRGISRGKLIMKVYKKGGVGDASIRKINERFLTGLYVTPTQTLGTLVKKGLFSPLEIVVVEQPFPDETKEAKIVQRI